jgi:branched-chain amino acid transport system substrate-binding protein
VYLLLALTWIIGNGSVWAKNEIRIGVVGPMHFSYGKEQWNGAELAAEEINADGGIQVGNKKMKIRLFKEDSAEMFSVAAAATAMEKLILRDKCDFVMGGLTSEASLAMQDVAMDNKTIFFSTGPASPELTKRVTANYERYKYYFRSAPFSSDNLLKGVIHQLRGVSFVMKRQMPTISHFKVALLIEKALWADPMVAELESTLPQMGMEVVGTWRPGMVARDLSAELRAIESTGCHIILTILNGPVGVTLGRQYGELQIPAVIMGVISQAGNLQFHEATQGKGDYIMTSTLYTRNLEINDLTKKFVDGYYRRYKEIPQYTALTHTTIQFLIKPALEKVGSFNTDRLIRQLESQSVKFPGGVMAFVKDEMGRPTHDTKWGPNYATGIAAQWQNGELIPVWPHFKWMSPRWEFSVEPPKTPNRLSYKGLKSFKIAPWVLKTK